MGFLEHHFFYFILMLFSLAYPLHRVLKTNLLLKVASSITFYSFMMLLFIPWDIWFTHWSVWQFNSDYICGLKVFLLPIEEWLFFVIIPLLVSLFMRY